MPDIKILTEKMQQDRDEMARRICEMAACHGATVHIRRGGEYPGPRAVSLDITAAHGLQVCVTFDGAKRNPDEHLLAWNMAVGAKATLNPATFEGQVNTSHFCKATSFAKGFDDLCAKLKKGLALAASGKAFREQLVEPTAPLAIC